ncbi:MAG: hypothetical protein PF481_04465 [Bacteroidales bacterium]|jgi:hypothetical protein|nr:hypothetical protein [Bacteroidales bacterium]
MKLGKVFYSRRFLSVFVLLLFGYVCFSQLQTYEFVGALKTSENAIITYKLVFVEYENGNIEGYTITDFAGKNRTKSNISGRVDFKKKVISFSETQNVYTQSDAGEQEFCYVHVKQAEIQNKNNKSFISGNFQGLFPNNEICVDGTLNLVSKEVLLKAYNKAIEKDTSITDLIDFPEIINTNANNHIQSGDDFKISWLSDTIRMYISDEERIDGDKISLIINGEKVLENYELTKNKKTISVPITQSEYVMEIVAVNEGSHSPNTAYIQLVDSDNTCRVISHLNMLEKATITIKKR